MFLIAVLFMLSAASFTLAKAALSYVEPIFYVGFRMFCAGFLLLGYIWLKDKKFPRIKKEDWWAFGSIVIFHIYLAFVLDLLALNHMSSFKGAFIYNLSPFIAALFSYFYFKEHMTLKKWLGLLIGFSGFLPELMAHAPQEGIVRISGFLSVPELQMIGSVIAAVYGWIVVRGLVHKGYSPFFINGFGMLGGGLLAFLTSFFYEGWVPSPVHDWMPFFKFTALNILAANILFYNLYGYLLKKYTATFLLFAGFLTPLFAALFSWMFLPEETVSWTFFFSLFVVVIGLALFYSEELRQGYIKK